MHPTTSPPPPPPPPPLSSAQCRRLRSPHLRPRRHVHLQSFFGKEDQIRLVSAALQSHEESSGGDLEECSYRSASASASAMALRLGAGAGGCISRTAVGEVAEPLARAAFRAAAEWYRRALRRRQCRLRHLIDGDGDGDREGDDDNDDSDNSDGEGIQSDCQNQVDGIQHKHYMDELEEMALACHLLGGSPPRPNPSSTHETAPHSPPPLTGLALLYGPHASMPPHHDSPTQPGRAAEWLVVLSAGSNVRFRCDERVLVVRGGDAVVLDSLAVLHGVEGVDAGGQSAASGGSKKDDCGAGVDPAAKVGLPIEGSRLGVLLWQGRTAPASEDGDDDKDGRRQTTDAVEEMEDGVMQHLFAEAE